MHKVRIQQFEGPLDLLLQLIESNKLDITEVSLAHVTEQYIQTLHGSQDQIGPNELADFLVIASKLLVIKSKALLPYLIDEEEEDEEDLERQLRMYREFFEASKKIQNILGKKKFLYSRPKLFVQTEVAFHPPENATVKNLKSVFEEIIKELKPTIDIPKNVIKKTIHINEKIQHIRDMIAKNLSLNFKNILNNAKDKTEVIVSFLALLELTKQRIITVDQGKMFQDITIRKV